MTDVTASALADALRDRYRLERELGRGGMATVYLAHDLKHDRDVALSAYVFYSKGLLETNEPFLSPSRVIRRIAWCSEPSHTSCPH